MLASALTGSDLANLFRNRSSWICRSKVGSQNNDISVRAKAQARVRMAEPIATIIIDAIDRLNLSIPSKPCNSYIDGKFIFNPNVG
jgi:hypothetical protein